MYCDVYSAVMTNIVKYDFLYYAEIEIFCVHRKCCVMLKRDINGILRKSGENCSVSRSIAMVFTLQLS